MRKVMAKGRFNDRQETILSTLKPSAVELHRIHQRTTNGRQKTVGGKNPTNDTLT